MKCTKVLISALLLAVVLGCGESAKPRPPFTHRNAVFLAAAENDTATSPVELNFLCDANGHPKDYVGCMALKQGAIEIRYEFVGEADYPLENGRTWETADAYIVTLAGEQDTPEIIPVLYLGERQVIVDRPTLQLALEQWDSKELAAAGFPPRSGSSHR